ncbi:hypothetical protein [Methanococcoides seepicolus]|jgi:hypothetical protein|uniref:Uncharacterized protein n=1 Tax=Methanococcoides seepicolus TaxID=2828780 RepID=A0A9E4ZHZ2_9EURY|nr:hypothetical protein [Methanococcoides seepicolus]MCM1987199.1 hypothetical protein [Methanococcoides seepicolus]
MFANKWTIIEELDNISDLEMFVEVTLLTGAVRKGRIRANKDYIILDDERRGETHIIPVSAILCVSYGVS